MRTRRVHVLALAVLVAARTAGASPPEVAVTQIGSPNWRPIDFHLFSAPAFPFPAEFNAVVDTLAPFDGFNSAYVPHDPPYNAEIAAGMVAGSYVDRTDFLAEDIDLQPNAVYFAYVLEPFAGVLGSSRDFALGFVIPNAVAPIARDIDMWLDGVRVDRLLGADANVNGDFAFDGFSHAPIIHVVWYPWDDDLEAGPTGSYEIRETLRDSGGNGWDLVVPFVVPEPPAGATAFVALLAVFGSCFGQRRP